MGIIDKIKTLFLQEAEAEVKFLDAKLIDGTIVRVDADAFKVGDKLSVITEAGEVVSAPEGSHEIDNGMVLIVDAEGVITEVVSAPEVTEDVTEPVVEPVEAAEEVAEPETEVVEVVEEVVEEDAMVVLETRVTQLEEALMMLAEQLKASLETQSTTEVAMSKLKIENKKLKSSPAAEPVKLTKFESIEMNDKNNKYARIASIIAKK